MSKQIQVINSWFATSFTPLAQLGVGILASILAIWIWLVMSDTVDSLEMEIGVAIEAAVPVPLEVWEPREAAARDRLASAEAKFWIGATAGEINARILTELKQATVGAGIQDSRIEISPDAAMLSGIQVASIVVEGKAAASQILTLLNLLRLSEGRLIVQGLSFKSPEAGRMRLELLAPMAAGETSPAQVPR